jgi:hypothetical protein
MVYDALVRRSHHSAFGPWTPSQAPPSGNVVVTSANISTWRTLRSTCRLQRGKLTRESQSASRQLKHQGRRGDLAYDNEEPDMTANPRTRGKQGKKQQKSRKDKDRDGGNFKALLFPAAFRFGTVDIGFTGGTAYKARHRKEVHTFGLWHLQIWHSIA